MASTPARYHAHEDTLTLDGLDVAIRRAGEGSPVLALHGFPHTKDVWRAVEPHLVAAGHELIAPDLRGLGASGVTVTGYDAQTLASDQVRLLDALGLGGAHVVGFDLGAAPAFTLAASYPDRVLSLTVVEAVVGGLDGAESFLAAGGPWWFGFHQAPGGLAETLVEGAEDAYVRFFLTSGSRSGVPDDLVSSFIRAYSGRDRLRAAFEHYRAMPDNAEVNRGWAGRGRLRAPVSAVGAAVVGDALARQLERVADRLTEYLIPESGHIVPVDAPERLAEIVTATARLAVTA